MQACIAMLPGKKPQSPMALSENGITETLWQRYKGVSRGWMIYEVSLAADEWQEGRHTFGKLSWEMHGWAAAWCCPWAQRELDVCRCLGFSWQVMTLIWRLSQGSFKKSFWEYMKWYKEICYFPSHVSFNHMGTVFLTCLLFSVLYRLICSYFFWIEIFPLRGRLP